MIVSCFALSQNLKVIEALEYANDAKGNSNHTPYTTGNIPSSFHSDQTDHSKDGASAHSNFSQSDSLKSSEESCYYAC